MSATNIPISQVVTPPAPGSKEIKNILINFEDLRFIYELAVASASSCPATLEKLMEIEYRVV